MTDKLDPEIQGPTEEFGRHHETTRRAEGPGRRVETRLERLLLDDLISPARFAAGLRYERDFVASGNATMPSSMGRIGPGGGVGAADNDHRIDAGTAYRKAATAVNVGNFPVSGVAPARIMESFLVDKESYRAIGFVLGRRGEDVKALVCAYLVVLERHYEEADRENGNSRTPQTKEAALRMVEPKDPDG